MGTRRATTFHFRYALSLPLCVLLPGEKVFRDHFVAGRVFRAFFVNWEPY